MIGFAGDVHGLVYHAIALVTTWQRKTGKKLDLVVQVGDMGAYHALDRVDEAGRRHIALDPAQADFSRLRENPVESHPSTGDHRTSLWTPGPHRVRLRLLAGVTLARGLRENTDPAWLVGSAVNQAGSVQMVPAKLDLLAGVSGVRRVEWTK